MGFRNLHLRQTSDACVLMAILRKTLIQKLLFFPSLLKRRCEKEADLNFFQSNGSFSLAEVKPPALLFCDLHIHTDKVNYMPWLNDFP